MNRVRNLPSACSGKPRGVCFHLRIKSSGFHEVRPVVKLADGTLLVGDHTDASIAMFAVREFALADVRWIKLDPNRVVTLGSNGPANQIWVNNPDLSKVDEVGFVDLMPGSGHGTGGYIHLGTIEVYGKAVPRETTTSSRKPQLVVSTAQLR